MISTTLNDCADLASLATFLVGVGAYFRFLHQTRQKSKRLEDYLRAEKNSGRDQGQRTPLQIMREVGLTEDEIIQASFRNKRIGRRVKVGQDGLAERLLFVYEPPET